MKKFLSFAAAIAMVAMLVCAFPVAVSAFDAPIPPEIVITEMDCNPSGADNYEFIEIMNTTDSEIDLYKYCLGYCGSANTTLDSYEQILVEITPIAEDWLDIGADVADDKKYTATAKNPASGVIAANEVAVLWIVTGDNYKDNAMTTSVADFRSAWGIGEDVKVFMVDGNTAPDKNFNMKNSAVGTYVIAEYNETLEAKANVKGSDGYVTLDGWMNDPYIISWATLNYTDKNSPSYIVSQAGGGLNGDGNGAKNDSKSLAYVYNVANQKRMVPYEYGANTVGKLSDAQKAVYMPDEVGAIDYTEIDYLIYKAEGLVESNYGATSWAAMTAALESAKTVRANAASDKTAIDNEVNALFAAINALEGIAAVGIGDKTYTSFEEAIAAAKTGDTLTLLRNVTVADHVLVYKSVTIDGNGKTMTSTGDAAIKVRGEKLDVTVKNLTVNSANTGIKADSLDSEANRSSLTIKDCTFNVSGTYKDRAGIILGAYWDNTITNCTVNSECRGIYTAGVGYNTTVIDGCTVNAKTSNGYGIYLRTNSTVTISNTSVTSDGQSAIQIITSAKDAGTELTLNNVNVTSAGAYAIAVNPNNSVYINGGTYKTTGADAVVNVVGYGAYTKITDGYFECDKNCAIRVYWSNDTYADCGIPVLDIYGGTFVYTATDDDGSALRAGTGSAWGTANIYGGTFKTYGAGPVVNYVRAEGVINIAGGTYENCGTHDIKVATLRYGGADVTDRDYVFPAGVKKVVWQNGELVDPDAQPEITEPEVTTPELTEPEATTPEVTEPEVTTPEVTEPEVTTPEATTPEITEPEVTSAPDEPDAPIVGDNIGTIIIIIAISLVAIASTVAFVVIKKKEN